MLQSKHGRAVITNMSFLRKLHITRLDYGGKRKCGCDASRLYCSQQTHNRQEHGVAYLAVVVTERHESAAYYAGAVRSHNWKKNISKHGSSRLLGYCDWNTTSTFEPYSPDSESYRDLSLKVYRLRQAQFPWPRRCSGEILPLVLQGGPLWCGVSILSVLFCPLL